MRRKIRPPFRNRLDLADRTQVRVVSRRLRLSEAQLTQLVDRIGSSIAALSKEVALRRAVPPEIPPAVPSPAVAAKALAASELGESATTNAAAAALPNS
jgi:Protein of unknown function (DUF3606)